ncbi:type II secretion system protein GspL [Sphingomicrobium flavum]|uniref:type II secretion system protein GspL n=1 Tax=Sphingomicrobium flavum TaxID=1229164 RepID=UPI0021AE0F86|nr:type II secretion system protein GspL [Sphingomicrobium flavum]
MKRLLLLLPERPDDHGVEVPWWLAEDGNILARGSDGAWRDHLIEDPPVSAIAPAGAARIELVDKDAIAAPQARTAARLAVIDRAIGGPDRLHSAIGTLPDERGLVAVVDKKLMEDWLGWARRHDLDLRHLFPAASLIPADGKWHEAQLAGHIMVGRDGKVFADSPELLAALVGDAFVDTLDQAALEAALLREAEAPSVDLRSGAFAYRKPWRIEPGRLKEFAVLIALILFVWLLIPFIQALRYTAAADRLDEESAALASDVLGRAVSAEEAETALMATGGQQIVAGDALAALLAALQSENLVRAETLTWAGNGQIAASLSAPDEQALGRLVSTLQRDGWQVSSTPRASTDGRAAIDLTMGGA